MSKRNSEQYLSSEANLIAKRKNISVDDAKKQVGCVIVLDIERMAAFAATEGADEINDLYRLWEKS